MAPQTLSPPDTSSYNVYATATPSTSGYHATSTPYPVFPNGVYAGQFIGWFVPGAADEHLNTDLWNECYLPARPLLYDDRKRAAPASSTSSRPDYLINEAPCLRQAAINSNCYFKNSNGTFSGLGPYTNDFGQQQQCYCEKYPFFDSASGCNACFLKHGGIEGYHWFPQEFINAASSTYCGAKPLSTDFYAFVSQWAQTQDAVAVPSTTASDVLGTQTAASLYYTYTATAAVSQTKQSQIGLHKTPPPCWKLSMMLIAITLTCAVII